MAADRPSGRSAAMPRGTGRPRPGGYRFGASLPVQSFHQVLPERDRVVVLLVARAVEQGDVAGGSSVAQCLPGLRMPVQLREVAAPEVVPLLGLVAEPLPQFRAGPDVREPVAQPQSIPPDPAGPQSVDQEPRLVPHVRLVVHAGDADRSHGVLRGWTWSVPMESSLGRTVRRRGGPASSIGPRSAVA